MVADACPGTWAFQAQYEKPAWQPLIDAVGERLAAGFMWMHEAELDDGSALHAYKHIHTRRYLYLTADLRAFEFVACGRLAPLRLDFAIEQAICTWWILHGWDEEDRHAVSEAVQRACDRVHSTA
jgi:hypothetical protein